MKKTNKLPAAPGKTTFAGDVATLAMGTGLTQAIGILAAPLIARLFSPEAFGISALFGSLTGVIAIVVCLRYELAIVLAESDEDAVNVLSVSLGFVLLITLLTMPCVWLLRTPFLGRFNTLGNSLWLLPLAVALSGLYSALSNWGIRQCEFSLLTIVQLIISVGTMGAQIVMGFAGFLSGRTLIAIFLFGLLLGNFTLVLQLWRNHCELLSKIRWDKMMFVIERYVRFPKYSTGAAVLNVVSWQLPTFFLSGFFPNAVVGQYALGNRLLSVPMNLIGTNIGTVFFQRGAEAKRAGDLAKSVENAFRYLVSLSMFPCLLLAFIGKDLFVVAFGAKWAEAGIYTQILSFWVCFWFVSSPLSVILRILEEQPFELYVNVLIFGSRFLSLLVGCLVGNARLTLALFSASGVLVYGYYSLAILQKSGVSRMAMLRVLAKNFALFIPAALILGALKYYGASSLVTLAVGFLILVFYYAGLIRTDAAARGMLRTLLQKFVPAPACSASQ
jgi:lipopolysaccharide exporter